MKFNNLIFSLFLIATFASCNTSKDLPASEMSDIARSYLNELVTIIQQHSIKKNEIDWKDYKKQVFGKVINAESIKDTYPAVRYALTLLQDNHSMLLRPSTDPIRYPVVGKRTISCESNHVWSPDLPEDVAYIRVHSFVGNDKDESLKYSSNIQNKIRAYLENKISKFVIDLRGNGGGNMWPMLQGIGPLLDAEKCGYFIDADDEITPWIYQDIIVKSSEGNVPSNDMIMDQEKIRIAVLQDNGTASSGEAIVIAFKGRKNTKSFGSSTCGASTSNQGFPLSDGSILALTSAIMADRNMNKYGSQIFPDVSSTPENIVVDALKYLQSDLD